MGHALGPACEEVRVDRILVEYRRGDKDHRKPVTGLSVYDVSRGAEAALIDAAGLKGFRVGNAAISEKHAGFAVNLGGATAKDVKELLETVSDRVFEQSGIRLEPEIRIW